MPRQPRQPRPLPFVRKAKTIQDLLTHSDVSELLSEVCDDRDNITALFVMAQSRDGAWEWSSANISPKELIAELECMKMAIVSKELRKFEVEEDGEP